MDGVVTVVGIGDVAVVTFEYLGDVVVVVCL
jgi:hypothetical protein